MGLVNMGGESNQGFSAPPQSLNTGGAPQTFGSQAPTGSGSAYQMPSMGPNTQGFSAPGTQVFNGFDPKQNPGMTPEQANAARTANGVPTQPAGTTGSGGTNPGAPGSNAPAALNTGIPQGFSATGPGGQAAPTGMGDLLWDTKNNQWVNASAAQDRGWWNGQSQGWQQINQMDQGSARTQAAIDYAAAHPDEPMLGQVGGYGYGPTQTMQLAGQYGYTWMPGIGGDPIQMAPGLSMANSNLKEYDPNNAPAGSIQVPKNLVHAPQGTGYTDESWLASHGGATGNTPFLNPANAAPANNINNPYTNPGSTGQGGLVGQTLGNGPGGMQQFGGSTPNALNTGGAGGVQGPTGGVQHTNSFNNSLDPNLLAFLASLTQSGYSRQMNPYGYSEWTPTGGGAGINHYGITGGGYGQQSSQGNDLNSVMQLLAQLTGQGGGAGLSNSGYGG